MGCSQPRLPSRSARSGWSPRSSRPVRIFNRASDMDRPRRRHSPRRASPRSRRAPTRFSTSSRAAAAPRSSRTSRPCGPGSGLALARCLTRPPPRRRTARPRAPSPTPEETPGTGTESPVRSSSWTCRRTTRPRRTWSSAPAGVAHRRGSPSSSPISAGRSPPTRSSSARTPAMGAVHTPALRSR